MKHNATELYKINGAKFYTEDYIKANNIPKSKRYTDDNGWSIAHYLGTGKDDFRIYTAEGVKIAYAYGEKTWFDTREERDAYREEQAIARANACRKNKLVKAINEKLADMSEEELMELLKKI
jgi:hypothetical protein